MLSPNQSVESLKIKNHCFWRNIFFLQSSVRINSQPLSRHGLKFSVCMNVSASVTAILHVISLTKRFWLCVNTWTNKNMSERVSILIFGVVNCKKTMKTWRNVGKNEWGIFGNGYLLIGSEFLYSFKARVA